MKAEAARTGEDLHVALRDIRIRPGATPSTTAEDAVQPGAADAVPPSKSGKEPLLAVRGLKKHFPIVGGLLRKQIGTVYAVDGVDFDVFPGEIFSLVGESGCGKTTLGRTRPAADPADRRQGRLRRLRAGRRRPRRHAPAAAPDADHLPGPVRVAQPADADQRHHRRGAAGPGRHRPQDARQAGRGLARDRRAPARLHAPLPARVQRRPATAHRYRPSARARAGPHRLRRAGLGPRRVDPEPGPEPAARPATRLQPDVPLHQPQPFGRPVLQRPGRRDVPRQARRGGRGRAALPRSRATRTRSRCCRRSPMRTRAAARSASSSRATCPSPAAPPSGCRFHTRCWLREKLGNPERCSTEEPELRAIGDGHRTACHLRGGGQRPAVASVVATQSVVETAVADPV